MFGINSKLTVCIAVFPNTTDDWWIDSPFPGELLNTGEEYFVLSNGSDNLGATKAHYVNGRFKTLSKWSNEVNFITKTKVDSKNPLETEGIGGMSKLKDFSFTLSRGNMNNGLNPMLPQDIIGLYGRKIIVYFTNTNSIEEYDSINSEEKFVGKIFSVKGTENDITFTVRGMFNVSEATIKGATVTNLSGEKVMNGIVLGDTNSRYVKLHRIKDDNDRIELSFNQTEDFVIKRLYTRGKTHEDENIYLPIVSQYHIADNKIYFEREGYSQAKFRGLYTNPNNTQITKLMYTAQNIVAMRLDLTEPYSFQQSELYYFFWFKSSQIIGTPPEHYTRSRMVFLKKEIIDDGVGGTFDIHYFQVGNEFINELAFVYKVIQGVYKDDQTYEPRILLPSGNTPNYRPIIIGSMVEYQSDLIDKMSDMKAFNQDTWWNSSTEPSTDFNKNNSNSIKVFYGSDEEGIILRIGNEEMLVIATDKNSGEGEPNGNGNPPEDTACYVIRGYNGIVEEHSDGDNIYVRAKDTQKIRSAFSRPAQDIRSLSTDNSAIFSNLIDFIKNDGTLTLDCHNVDSNITPYIGLDFNLPDIKGDIVKVELRTTATVSMRNPSTMSNYNYQSWVGVAFNEVNAKGLVAKGLAVNSLMSNYEARRIVGKQVGGVTYKPVYETAFAFLSKSSHNKYEYSGFPVTLDIKDNVYHAYFADKNIGEYADIKSNIYPVKDNQETEETVGIIDMDNLKETNIFITFQNAFHINGGSSFTLKRPTMYLELDSDLKDTDIYAELIPRKSLTTIFKLITLGDNVRFVLSRDNGSNIRLTVDDTSYGLREWIIDLNGNTTQLGSSDPRTLSEGILTTRLSVEFDDSASPIFTVISPDDYSDVRKIIGSEYYYMKFNDPNYEIVVGSPVINGYEEEGVTFAEWGNFYIWYNPINRTLGLYKKESSLFNPVTVIEEIFQTYVPEMQLDSGSFDLSRVARALWRCSIIITEETSVRMIVNRIALNHGLIVYENNLGEIAIKSLTIPTDLTSLRDISDDNIIFKNYLVDIREEYTDLTYLITKLDTYYEEVGNGNYKGLIKSEELSYQDALNFASEIVEQDVKTNLMLRTIIDRATADNSAVLKSTYHYTPTRFITIGCTMGESDIQIGDWLTISSNKIHDYNGKIYLVLKTETLPPIGGSKYRFGLRLYEFDSRQIRLQIHEVPEENVNTNYDEVLNTTEQIGEVPNAS